MYKSFINTEGKKCGFHIHHNKGEERPFQFSDTEQGLGGNRVESFTSEREAQIELYASMIHELLGFDEELFNQGYNEYKEALEIMFSRINR